MSKVTIVLSTELPNEPETEFLIEALRADAVLMSVGVALAGVIVAVTVFMVNTRIARRSATIEAWRDWARGTAPARTRLGESFPALRMSRKDALRIRERTAAPPPWRRSQRLQHARLKECRRDISLILNELERIAAGSRLGILDKRLLKRLAGTRIPAAYVRFEQYIDVVREGQPTRPPQAGAYSELTKLVTWMVGGNAKLEELRRSRTGL